MSCNRSRRDGGFLVTENKAVKTYIELKYVLTETRILKETLKTDTSSMKDLQLNEVW